MRGVPRERIAISAAPSWSISILMTSAERETMKRRSSSVLKLEAEEDAEAGAERRGEQAGRVVAATKVKGRISMTWVRAAGPWPMMMSSL